MAEEAERQREVTAFQERIEALKPKIPRDDNLQRIESKDLNPNDLETFNYYERTLSIIASDLKESQLTHELFTLFFERIKTLKEKTTEKSNFNLWIRNKITMIDQNMIALRDNPTLKDEILVDFDDQIAELQ